MAGITNSVATMETGTREIASGTDHLSKRTEQQASAQQQTPPAKAVGEWANQPLQADSTDQVQIECIRNMPRVRFELGGNGQHCRHDQVAGHVSYL